MKVLIPLAIVIVIAIVVLILHKRESKGAQAESLLKELRNEQLKTQKSNEFIASLDTMAVDEYAVTASTFAWNVADRINIYKRGNK